MANLNTDLISPEQAIEATVAAYNSKDALGKINGLEASASEIDGSVNLAHPSLNNILIKLEDATANVSILVNSDSTGDAFDEWVRYFSDWLAVAYPKFTVRYRFWNDTTQTYNDVSVRNTGTTAYYIDVFNACKGGSTDTYFLNPTRWGTAIKDITDTSIYPTSSSTIDLVIINHGHNCNLGPNNTSNKLRHYMFFDNVAMLYPQSSWLCIRQNPWQSFNNKQRIKNMLSYAYEKKICIANVWDKFIENDMNTALFLNGTDDIHPSPNIGTAESPTGTQLMLEAVTEQMTKKINYNINIFETFITKVGKSILNNSNLLHTSGDSTVPTGFTVDGGTAIKDTSVYINPSKLYSTKITATGGVACTFRISPNITLIAGEIITLAILMKTEDSTNTDYISTWIHTSGGFTQDINTIIDVNGGWHWRFLSMKIPSSVSTGWAVLKLDLWKVPGSTPAGTKIWLDKFMCFRGELPFGETI